jgi:hypothetical protein
MSINETSLPRTYVFLHPRILSQFIPINLSLSIYPSQCTPFMYISLGLPYDPCTESYALNYLNLPAVQFAMHVIQYEQTPITFSFCNDVVFQSWAVMDSFADTTHLYQQILNTVPSSRAKSFALLVFSGG